MTSDITTQNTDGESSIYQSQNSFEFAQRQAKSLCESNLVPTDYRGQKGLPNCLVALEMSKRMNLSPLTVMQNLNIIHGTPSWSAQFISSQILGCGRFTNFDYIVSGQGETLEVQCVAKRVEDQKIVKGTPVSMRMAKLEGWTRNSKYQSMPELMLRNRAATFFGRQYIPDLLLGVQTSEEVVDIQPLNVTPETDKESLNDHGM
ncbi:MAG: hypothetical protein CML98_04120 [Rhodobiaceae bacterium]|nr:hypothetical protein [Rhodobiaceae bacterium]|tara:strand:- start:2171 stop:2782 length:612 start_codon:yes stop_codon:yes gene_type:complete